MVVVIFVIVAFLNIVYSLCVCLSLSAYLVLSLMSRFFITQSVALASTLTALFSTLPTNPRAWDHLERLRKIQMDLSTHLRHVQHTQKTYADRHRLLSYFSFGDRLWLLRRHIKTTRPCDKLDYRRLGPFRFTSNDVTFRLDLPPHLRIHPVFHSSLLEPYKANTIPDRVTPPPPPLEVDAGPEYEVVVFKGEIVS